MPVKTAQKTTEKPKSKKVKLGDRYECTVCGLIVSIDEVCGCIETCDIVCCGKQMKRKK
jgi:hypothetical protein